MLTVVDDFGVWDVEIIKAAVTPPHHPFKQKCHWARHLPLDGEPGIRGGRQDCLVRDESEGQPEMSFDASGEKNIGEDHGGLAYELDVPDGGDVPVVAWFEQPVTMSADEAMVDSPAEVLLDTKSRLFAAYSVSVNGERVGAKSRS